ncbi:MAG: pyridoxine 5'-phosphate synthase [Methylobacterium sp.]|jgi:pyridoxine 5-phosphate synthase|nr:pyridoxine 5'-phosphate synthase [Methylobacterium sp.]MCA3598895.1 pyridoxine 5'-phosphate synthase [Methylobacterium sp.]MCA3600393.1 pyridoxine 5'-phosphate synthase [Methylobacterium sp.]MCA3603956.1 pyridoxine 5'-phosphate synthase [Methylobacterium sp.]MCA3605239.1 pyridoxine 5'-phosphate synthase [Methylobacterium sp.]
MSAKLRLGVNIDHVATVRNARGGARPDPVRAALLAIEAGADGITAHLREDRRHIRDADIERLKAEISKPLNFEMAVTDEMLAIATRTRPHACCLVPEKREERTTEGGLDVVGQKAALIPAIAKLKAAGCRISLFIEPDEAPIRLSRELGADIVELHTGTWCHAVEAGDAAKAEAEFQRLKAGAAFGASIGLEMHAGHGLDFDTAEKLATVPEFVEFNIGHFLMGEAIFIGLPEAIRQMRASMDRGVVWRA